MKIIENFPTGEPKIRTEGAKQLLDERPKIPEELYELANRQLFNHFIFEQRDYELPYWSYRCSHCGAEWEDSRNPALADNYDIVRGKHNSEVCCPYCGTESEKKIVSKCGQMFNLNQWRSVLFIVRHSENRVYGIRGSLARYFTDGYWKANELFFIPETVHIWTPGRAITFLSECCYDPKSRDYSLIRFREAASPDAIGNRHGSVCDATYVIGAEQLDNSFLRYCGLKKVLNATKDSDVLYSYDEAVRWLTAYVRNPSIEFLTKFPELTQIIYATISEGKRLPELFNWRAKTPDRFFRMTKPEVKWLISPKSVKHDLIERLRFRMELKKIYPNVTLPESDELYLRNGGNDLDRLLNLISRLVGIMSPKQIENYIIRQESNFADRYIGRHNYVETSWRDYLDMAEKLGYDMTDRVVLAPKNLREAHDRAVEISSLIKAREIAEASKKRKKLLNTLYNWSDGDILIRPPKDAAEIVAEGQILHHCVGGYAARHNDGKTTILFVRKCSEPDVPLYTMELDAQKLWHLKQIHGLHNCDPDKETMAKIQAWLDAEGKPETKSENETITKEKVS